MNLLENNLIPFEEWEIQAPEYVYSQAIEEHKLGIPTGIGFTEDLGWYIIQTSRQGPYLIYSDKDNFL